MAADIFSKFKNSMEVKFAQEFGSNKQTGVDITGKTEKFLRLGPEQDPRKVEMIKRIQTTFKLSLNGNVNKAIIVTIFAKPNLAPGANANGKGIERSKSVITTPCAARSDIYNKRLFFFILLTFNAL